MSYLAIDQNSLDEWHDSGAAVWEALKPLGIDQAVLTRADGSQRFIERSREDEEGDSASLNLLPGTPERRPHDGGYQPEREEPEPS
jgi:hypothetical protein